jgi:hypothetical protein
MADSLDYKQKCKVSQDLNFQCNKGKRWLRRKPMQSVLKTVEVLGVWLELSLVEPLGELSVDLLELASVLASAVALDRT